MLGTWRTNVNEVATIRVKGSTKPNSGHVDLADVTVVKRGKPKTNLLPKTPSKRRGGRSGKR